jgi:hypothetical protein
MEFQCTCANMPSKQACHTWTHRHVAPAVRVRVGAASITRRDRHRLGVMAVVTAFGPCPLACVSRRYCCHCRIHIERLAQVIKRRHVPLLLWLPLMRVLLLLLRLP